jgi:perosamine synthetase
MQREQSARGISSDPHKRRPGYLPLYRPQLAGNERDYILRCLETADLATGEFVAAFEQLFAEVTGAEHAIAVSSGTAALHLSLHALGLGPGDEVIAPTLTFVATINAIAQTGATPVFVDCDPEMWVATPAGIEAKISDRTRAIVAVHLYGAVCDMVALRDLAKRHDLLLIEDCAQAAGSTRLGQHVGTWGKAGTFSFYGNKTITTGEGGMIVTGDKGLADRLRQLRNHASAPARRYWHEERGFNYKMTNLAAAIGLAQLERLPAILARKLAIASFYRSQLAEVGVVPQRALPDVRSAEWLFTLLLPQHVDRDAAIDEMEAQGVECRPTFRCVHEMPPYLRGLRFPASETVARRGISLPSYPDLADEDVERVCASLARVVRSPRSF